MSGGARLACEATVAALDREGDGVVDCAGARHSLPFAAPGDSYRLHIRGGEVRAAERIGDGPNRVAAPCRHFESCGGCAVQHVSDAVYAEWKRDLVVRALARGKVAADVAPLVRMPSRSRRRARLSARATSEGCLLGFNARRSHTIVDVTACEVLVPKLAELLPALRRILGETLSSGQRAEVSLALVGGAVEVVVEGAPAPALAARERLVAFAGTAGLARLVWGRDTIVQFRPVAATFAGVAVELPPAAFLQPTSEGEGFIAAAVAEALAGAKRVADLFAGCGAFTIPLAIARKRVAAYEIESAQAKALEAAVRRSAARLPVEVEVRDLERRPLAAADLAGFDGAVLDPPRAGAAAQAHQFAAANVAAVVYVSCNPVTFARDAAVLVAGGYRLGPVTPVDQFVWSPHVELFATFRRAAKRARS